MSDEAQRFGELFDRALGDGPPRASLEVQRANLFAAAHKLSRRPSRFRWELGLAAASALGVALLLVLWLGGRSAAPPLLEARWNGALVTGRAALLAPASAPLPLEFSDGSRMVFDPSSSAELSSLTPEHTRVRLAKGRFVAEIQHAPGRRWSIAAGPYTVEVVGTRFSVDWQSAARGLRVEVTEGRVRVRGGDLGAGVELGAGQELVRDVATPESKARDVAEPEPDRARAAASPEIERDPAEAERRTPRGREPTLRELARAGKYREALALAEQLGFERQLDELAENDLLLLANSARYSGATTRARQALDRVRSRFPGRPAAGLAALYLARIAEQNDRRPAEAARWLRVFLGESPAGELAEGARSSLLGILLSSGDTTGARAVAEDYLRYHPNGPRAEHARSLVKRTAPQ